MTTIRKDAHYVTQMNCFKVVPGRQQELIDRLIEFHKVWWSRQPGHVSVATHKSLDGAMVFNYVQYASKEQLDAAHSDPEFFRHLDTFKHLFSESAPKLYDVVDIQ